MPIPENIKAVLLEAHNLGLISLHRPLGYKRDGGSDVIQAYAMASGTGNVNNHPFTERELSRITGLPIPLNGYQLTVKDIYALTLLRDAIANRYKRQNHWHDFIDSQPLIL